MSHGTLRPVVPVNGRVTIRFYAGIMTRRHLVLGITAVYAVVLLYVAFWPTPVDRPVDGTLNSVLGHLHGWGAPSWVDYGFVQFTANVVLFAPLALILDSIWRTPPWRIFLFGVGASATIELLQLLLSPQRFATLNDVLANSLGTLVGIAILYVVGSAHGRVTAPGRLDPPHMTSGRH